MMISGSKLLLMTISGSLVLLKLGSVVMSVTTAAYTNHELKHMLNHVLKYKSHVSLPLTGPG